jgi:hypothetical protein
MFKSSPPTNRNSALTDTTRWPVRALAVLIVLASTSLAAHPLQYHLKPLDAARVERVLTAFETLLSVVERGGAMEAARLPDGALGASALVWSVQGAVVAMDDSAGRGGDSLSAALLASGYEDSPFVVDEWRFEAERVLAAYEVLSGDLRRDEVYAAMAELETEAATTPADELEERTAALVRQAELIHDTQYDVPAVAPFRARIDAFVSSLARTVP